jgi:hypothetical protein
VITGIRRSVSRWTRAADGFLAIVVLLLSLLVLSYSLHRWFDHDEFEHIHSAWYVANGYTPYTDFFQIHHPLLWYCLAPLLLLLGYSTQTVVIIRIAMFALTMAIAFITFLIARRVTSSTMAGLLSVILLLSMVMFLEKSVEIRPDVPQVLVGLVSVYFFVSFIQTQKNLHMVLAGITASLSFLFLQKTIFLLIAYALILCYSLVRRRISFRSTAYLIVSFSLPAVLFLAYLLLSGSFHDYVLTNWLMNARWLEAAVPIQDLSRSFVTWSALLWVLSAIAVAFVLLNPKTNKALKATAIAGAVLLLSVLFLAYLFTSGSLQDYVVINWVAITPWLETFPPLRHLSRSFATQNALFWLLSPVSVAFILLNRKTDNALKATAFIGIALLLLVLLVRARLRQYYMFAIPLLCIANGHLLERIVARFGLRGIHVSMLLIVLLCQPLLFLAPSSTWSGLRDKQLQRVDFVLDHSADSDLVYDGNIQFNLYRSDLHYFWFAVGEMYGGYNICQLVRSKQPTVISDYQLDITACGLRELYDQTEYEGLYVLRELEGVEHHVWREFGGVAALVGYDIKEVSAGGENRVQIRLLWRALARVDRDYTVFIHAAGRGDTIFSQVDTLLYLEQRPTSTWKAGTQGVGEYELSLPADALTNGYNVIVGLYYWETGERLPVLDEYGNRLPNDAAVLIDRPQM